MADEIMEEVWRIKDEIAREHGRDLDRLGAYVVRLGCEREERGKGARGRRARRRPETGGTQGAGTR